MKDIKKAGGKVVLTVKTDVSKRDQVVNLYEFGQCRSDVLVQILDLLRAAVGKRQLNHRDLGLRTYG